LRTVSVGMGPAAARPAETMRSRRAARRGAGMLPAGLCALLGLCLAIASSAAAARRGSVRHMLLRQVYLASQSFLTLN
jgi:hypothetical protein